MQPRHDRGHRAFVLTKIFAESLFQFFIFKIGHDCSTQQRECSQRIADGKTRAKTPSEHFAQLRKIDWMTNSVVYPCSDQPLLASSAHTLGTPADLLNPKLLPRSRLQPAPPA